MQFGCAIENASTNSQELTLAMHGWLLIWEEPIVNAKLLAALLQHAGDVD